MASNTLRPGQTVQRSGIYRDPISGTVHAAVVASFAMISLSGVCFAHPIHNEEIVQWNDSTIICRNATPTGQFCWAWYPKNESVKRSITNTGNLQTESHERRPELGSLLAAIGCMIGGIGFAGTSGRYRYRWLQIVSESLGVLLILDGTVGFLLEWDLWSILRNFIM